MLVSQAIESYLFDCYGLAERTQELYAWHLARFLRAVGDRPVSDVDAHAIRRYLYTMKTRKGQAYSLSFQDQVYRTLRTFFEWCVRESFSALNPMDKVRRPRVIRRKSPRLSLDEIGRLLDVVSHDPRNLTVILLMLDSGLRRSEVVGLEIRHIDLARSKATVCSKGKEREVPIGVATLQAINAYLAVRPVCDSPQLLLTKGGCYGPGSPLTHQGLGTLVRRIGDRAGIHLYCHLLRHTFANHYIANGGSIRKLQKILGHSDVTTTARIYTDPEFGELQDEHARVSPVAQLQLPVAVQTLSFPS